MFASVTPALDPARVVVISLVVSDTLDAATSCSAESSQDGRCHTCGSGVVSRRFGLCNSAVVALPFDSGRSRVAKD